MELVKILRDIMLTEGVKKGLPLLELAHETGLPLEEVIQREMELGLIPPSVAGGAKGGGEARLGDGPELYNRRSFGPL
jgi:hypothetical protein